MTTSGDVRVTDNPSADRYEITLDGHLAGFAEYDARHVDGGRIVFTHTEIDDAYEGHGLGTQLVREALDDVRRRGLAVVARCPFVRQYIDEHPAYQDLIYVPTPPGSG